MANEDHLEILNSGVEAWNRWREENPDTAPDLSHANLVGRALMGINLNGSKLDRVNLRLTNMSGADLSHASMVNADLSRTDLTHADLCHANLSMADLSRADLTEARIGMTTFGSTAMGYVAGLETVEHIAPSVIGVDTIYFSQGQIPDVFLRRAGVPENFVTYIRTTVTSSIQYDSCFISHGPEDRGFSRRLYDNLQEQNVRCWMSEGGDGGSGNPVDISNRVQDRLVLILSRDSIDTDWIRDEVGAALRREQEEREKRKADSPILLPVALDPALGDSELPWVVKMRRDDRVVDFSGWQVDSNYKPAFQELLGHLRRDPSPPKP